MRLFKSIGLGLFLLALGASALAKARYSGLRRCGTHRATGEFLFEDKQPVLKIHTFEQNETILRLRGVSMRNAARLFGQIVVLTGDLVQIDDSFHGEMEVTTIEKVPASPETFRDRDSLEDLSLISVKHCRKPGK